LFKYFNERVVARVRAKYFSPQKFCLVGARFIAPVTAYSPNIVRAPECGGELLVGAINRAPTTTGGFAQSKNPMLHLNLPRIVRWFKGRTTFECRHFDPAFGWQRNYYEHVIRDGGDHARVAEYIAANPANWASDDEYEEIV
jgi:hypothetical protein